MQHLLLALSIVLLTVIAGNGRRQTTADNVSKVMTTEKARAEKRPPVNEVESEFSICDAIFLRSS